MFNDMAFPKSNTSFAPPSDLYRKNVPKTVYSVLTARTFVLHYHSSCFQRFRDSQLEHCTSSYTHKKTHTDTL